MAKLPRLPHPPVVKRGPALYKTERDAQHIGWPGDPPPGFITVKTTATEWVVYWGLSQIFGKPEPEDLRHPPYVGYPGIWQYQAYVDAQLASATNIDFVVWSAYPSGTPIAIRVQTEFFHNYASNDQQVYDLIHRERLEGGFDVVDVFDFDFLHDESGRAIILILKEALMMIERPHAQRSGRTQRV
jgi:hypothetical protein